MTEAMAIVFGAAISALVTVLVVVVQHSLQRRHDRRLETAERLAHFSEAAYSTYLAVSRLAHAPTDEKPDSPDLLERIRGPLSSVILRDDEELVRAAHAMHRELIRLRNVGRERAWTRDAWWTERDHYTRLVEEFQQRSRTHLGVKPLSGSLEWGPAADPAGGATGAGARAG